MPVNKSRRQKVEQQQIIQETIDSHDSDTGAVTFPDHDTCRIQVICNGHCPPELLNVINSTVENGHYHVCEISHWCDDSFVVELER